MVLFTANSIDVHISGMRCTRCSNKIEDNLKLKDGIKEAVVSVGLSRGHIEYDEQTLGVRDIISIIKDLGFGATLIDELTPVDLIFKQQSQELRRWRKTFLSCLSFGLITMIFHAKMLIEAGSFHNHDNEHMHLLIPGLSSMNLFMFLLATPTMFIGGQAFYPAAIAALKYGRSNMDVLVFLATITGYCYSLISVSYFILAQANYSPRTFFDIPPMLFTFISLGRWLEHIARGKTSEALTKLMILQPKEAIIVKGYEPSKADLSSYNFEKEESIDIRMVQKGDIVKVLVDSKIPVDGVIVEGNAHVDESLVTGESMPISKPVGARVLCGSMNLNDSILVRATEVGKATTLAQIVKLVETAQVTKAPVQQHADRVASIFVPIIFFSAAITFFAWLVIGLLKPSVLTSEQMNGSGDGSGNNHNRHIEVAIEMAFQYALTVLSIACPCALGLATPTAVMVGTGVGAKNGILIRSAEALENAHRINHVIFDKTGTITSGNLVIDRLMIIGSKSFFSNSSQLTSYIKNILYLIGSTEINSSHPKAKTLAQFSTQVLSPTSWLEATLYKPEPGLGVQAHFKDFDLNSNRSNIYDGSLIEDSISSIVRRLGLSLPIANCQPNERPKFEKLISLGNFNENDTTIHLPEPSTSILNQHDHHEDMKKKEHIAYDDNIERLETLIKGVKLVLKLDNDGQKVDESVFNNHNQSISILIGSLTYLKTKNVHIDDSIIESLNQNHDTGSTCVLCAINGQLVAFASLNDEVKPEAKSAIKTLKNMNLRVMLLTGDNEKSARFMGKRVGIEEVFAEVLPQDKMAKIRCLQETGFKVAMVGDGVNDSPALAQADVGIAIAKGSDIAVEAANIVLVKNDLNDVVCAIDISRKTVNRIYLNFIFAIFYNAIGIPLAAGLFLPLGMTLEPWMGSAAMAASSLSVVCSSLALKFYHPPKRYNSLMTNRSDLECNDKRSKWETEVDDVELSHGLLSDSGHNLI